MTACCEWLTERGYEVVRTFEPGDTAVGAAIRQLVLDPATGDLSPRAEALLYAADKAQHVYAVVGPALARGGGGLRPLRRLDAGLPGRGPGAGPAEVEQVARWATDDLRPHLTVVLDPSPARPCPRWPTRTGWRRPATVFHERARQYFLELAAREPEHYLVLDARGTRDGDRRPAFGERLAPLLSAVGWQPRAMIGGGLGRADRPGRGRGHAAPRRGRRAARDESRLAGHRAARLRPVQCGPGLRRRAAVPLRRLR